MLNAEFGPAAPALALSAAAWELRALVLLGLPRFAEFALSFRISRCLVLLRDRRATRQLRALTGQLRGVWASGSSEGDSDIVAD